MIGLLGACLEGGLSVGGFTALWGSYFVPGLGTAGGFVIGFTYGCEAGIIAAGAFGYNPFIDPQGVY